MSIAHATVDTFQTDVVESDVPVLVDYWATWCSPCRQMEPVLEELADEYDGRLRIVKVDADTNAALMTAYGVTHLPTLSFFVGGSLQRSIVGGRPKKTLVREIDEVLAESGEPEEPAQA